MSGARERLAEALRANGYRPATHAGITDALLPAVQKLMDEHAAATIERIADERTWTTEHDNEVVSARDLYEEVARLRGELEPVTYDFPPDGANDGPGPDGHHTVTGECFACLVGVATGPESHGERCPRAAALRPATGEGA